MKYKVNAFDRTLQTASIESKIVVALERIAESFRVLLWDEAKQYGLSPIQVQLMVFMLTHDRQHCKISYLADEFNMTKATVSDAVRVLELKNLVQKAPEPADSRSFLLRLTPEGKKMAKKLSLFATPLVQPLSEFSNEEKEDLLSGLLHLIYNLHHGGIIGVQRMCFTCKYYSSGNGKDEHYCKLLNSALRNSELRIDCVEHEINLK
jgi:DNA-binding MarR family transcriptional regulator